MTENIELVLSDQIVSLQLTEIATNPWNPHTSTADELRLIADSIKELGQLVPVLVARWDAPITYQGTEYFQSGKYLLVDGEQRLKGHTQLFAAGDNAAINVRAIVIGNVSDYEAWELAEFGQAANHARATTEDDLKTGKVMSEILKHRNLTDYAKIVGQRPDYVSRTLELVKNRELRAIKVPTSRKPDQVPAATSHRGVYTVSLPFESSSDVEEFEQLISQLPEAGKTYKGLERSYRLINILKEYFKA